MYSVSFTFTVYSTFGVTSVPRTTVAVFPSAAAVTEDTVFSAKVMSSALRFLRPVPVTVNFVSLIALTLLTPVLHHTSTAL